MTDEEDDIYYNTKSVGSFGGQECFLNQINNNKSNAKKWLTSQLTYQLHKPIKLKYPTCKYSLHGVDVQFQADLVDMSKYANVNNGYKWMLMCMDLFSRYAWAIPVKTKSAENVLAAIKLVFAEHRPSELFQTDEGKEFYNKPIGDYLKSLDIHHLCSQ